MICTGFQASRFANRTFLEVEKRRAFVQNGGEQAFKHSSSLESERTSLVPPPLRKGQVLPAGAKGGTTNA